MHAFASMMFNRHLYIQMLCCTVFSMCYSFGFDNVLPALSSLCFCTLSVFSELGSDRCSGVLSTRLKIGV
jgi:hypothetical protein